MNRPSTDLAQAAADQTSWWCEAASSEFQFAPEVIEAMRAEAVEGLMRLARGGIECGGILYGLRTAGSIRVLAARPLPCEHRFGPSFLLSEKDEPALQEMLEPEQQADELRGLEPLGWYVSHCRRGPALAESDVRVSNQHFKRPGSITVVLLPEKLGQAQARVFVRDANGTLDPEVCAREMLLPGPLEQLASKVAAPAAAPVTDAAEKALVVAPRPIEALSKPPSEAPDTSHDAPYQPWAPAPHAKEAQGREVALSRLQSFLQQQEQHRRVSNWNLAATVLLLALLCGGGAAYFWIHAHGAHGPTPVAVRVAESGSGGSQLRIDWDTKSTAVQTATGGELEIREGDGPPVYASLDRNAVRSGSAVYNHRSDKVEIRLRLTYADAPAAESVVYFISPRSGPAEQKQADARSTEAPKDASAQAPPGPQTTSETEKARPVVATRTFQPPPLARSEPAPVTLNAAPPVSNVEIPTKPAAPVLPFTATAPPPPPAPAAAATAKPTEPPHPRHGRLIWTGDLARNALLTISSAGASLGWANGKLPGFPVTVSIHPAALVEGGIQVFTGDARGASHTETPSADNGWNTVVYKYDPKAAPDLHVLVAPGASNSWSQLVIQNGKKPVSVIVIDWQRAPEPAR